MDTKLAEIGKYLRMVHARSVDLREEAKTAAEREHADKLVKYIELALSEVRQMERVQR